MNIKDLTPDILNKLYWNEGKTLEEIGKIYNVSETSIRRRMKTWNIPRRDLIEAQTIRNKPPEIIPIVNEREKLMEDLKSLEPLKYKFKPRKNLWIPLPLSSLNGKISDARLTLVMSDFHLGDADHLPLTYWSTVANLTNIIKVLKKKFRIPYINVVLNGDIVSGREVFRFQELRNLLDRGHWQTAIAEEIIRETVEKIEKELKVKDIFLLKGTHESLAENYMMYLKREISGKYAGRYLVLNIAEDLGKYNVLFTHGYGSSSYFPISYSLVRDLWKILGQYRLKQVPIERVCIGHYHFLMTSLPFESFILDCTGGFQRWEYTISQRPSGVILYLFSEDEACSIPVPANPEIVKEELEDPALEYKNMRYYSEKLLKHLKEVEKIEI